MWTFLIIWYFVKFIGLDMFQMLFDVHKITQLVKNFCYMGQRSFGIWTEVFSYNLLCERMCLYYVLVFISVGGIEMLNDHILRILKWTLTSRANFIWTTMEWRIEKIKSRGSVMKYDMSYDMNIFFLYRIKKMRIFEYT